MLIKKFTTEQARAQMKFNEWNQDNNIVILDTATTGLYEAEIIEIAMVDREGREIFYSLVKPVNEIEPEAIEIHGIQNSDLVDAPNWLEVWEQIFPIIQKKKILVYNSEFDINAIEHSFLEYFRSKGLNPAYSEELEQFNQLKTNFECVMKTFSALKNSLYFKLSEAIGKKITPHRAKECATATLELLHKCYQPELTEEKLRLSVWYETFEQISREIRHLGYQIGSLQKRQEKLLTHQKKLLQMLEDGLPEDVDVFLGALNDPFIDDGQSLDISDDDLPF